MKKFYVSIFDQNGDETKYPGYRRQLVNFYLYRGIYRNKEGVLFPECSSGGTYFLISTCIQTIELQSITTIPCHVVICENVTPFWPAKSLSFKKELVKK